MPSAVNTHVDKLLSEVAIGYKQAGLVAEQIATPVTVAEQSGRFAVFGREAWRLTSDAATNISDIAEVNYEVSSSPYACQGHGLRHFVPNLRSEDAPFNELVQATEEVQGKILLNREVAVYNWVTTAANVTNSDSPSTKWDASTPGILAYIESRRAAVALRCGLKPNRLAFGPDVWAVIADDSEILDRVKYTQTGLVTTAVFEGLSDLSLVVPSAIYDSAQQGQTPVGALAWPAETALLWYQSPNGSMYSPDSFKLFNWSQAGVGVEVSQIADAQKGTHGGVWVQAVTYYDIRTTCDASAERLTDLLT